MGTREYLHHIALKAPSSSGVYLWKAEDGLIIYVGKAKSLKNRLTSYFSKNKDIKTRLLVSRARDIEYIETKNEYEALLLENTLIKQHKPKYNINLKDGKTYPVIKITNEDFPSIFRTRSIRDDGALYFGPFPNVFAVDTFLQLVKQNYKLRQCKVLRKKASPCLYYHIGRCNAPCCGKVSKEEYAKQIEEVKQFLTNMSSLEPLREEMQKAASALDFEKAKRFRDGINAITALHNQNVVEDMDETSRDYIAWASEGTFSSFAVLKMRSGKLVAREIYRSQSLKDDTEILEEFLTLFYTDAQEVPRTIFLPFGADYNVLETWFVKELKVNTKIFTLPLRPSSGYLELDTYSLDTEAAETATQYVADVVPRENGEVASVKDSTEDAENSHGTAPTTAQDFALTHGANDNLEGLSDKEIQHHRAALQMAFFNAREDITRRLRDEGDISGLQELKRVLNLPSLPSRIEGFDIAHLEGQFTVASLISFKDGNPDKKNYRIFKLKTTAHTNNDYASMKEAVARRYLRVLNEGLNLPDLILIDGGLGQVNVAYSVLQALHIDVAVIGLAEKNEEIYFPHNSEPLRLPKKSDALRLLQRVRDETHRFANSHNNRLRQKAALALTFEGLPHVGKKRAKLLLKAYGTREILSHATATDVATLLSISEEQASEIVASAKSGK